MTSQQAELVERWLDEQKKHRAKGKEVDRADKPEQEKEMERIPPTTFNLKAFLRVMSMNLCCTMFGFNIVMSYLIKSSPGGMSILDQELNWIISIPVAGLSFLWELSRFGISWWRPWESSDFLLDIIAEALLGVASAICAILAAFQAARHRSFNLGVTEHKYPDVWAEVALAVFLGFLMISSFGVLATSVIESGRRKGHSHRKRARRIDTVV